MIQRFESKGVEASRIHTKLKKAKVTPFNIQKVETAQVRIKRYAAKS